MPVDCTIALVYYKRPLFLAECIKSMYRKPGRPFELLIWSNDCENKGSYALEDIFKKVSTKYFVVIEEDEIWFQDDWLKLLVEAFEQSPGISEEGLSHGIKDEWGILASNTLSDNVNGGMPDYRGLIRYQRGRFIYWTNIRAGGGVMIFKTDVLRKLKLFKKDKHLNGGLYPLTIGYERNHYPQGRVEDIYIYHACTPYWNQIYPKVFEEKQEGQTIEDATKIYNPYYNFKDKEPLELFLRGEFNGYAERLYEKHIHHGQQGIYRFKIEKGI